MCSEMCIRDRMEIRRRGRWQSEERLLLPGYVFVGAEYTAALFHLSLIHILQAAASGAGADVFVLARAAERRNKETEE